MSQTISIRPKTYARIILKERGEDPNFIKAVAAYVDAETFMRNGIGSPVYNISRAQKVVSKLSLSESEEARAIRTAKDTYQEFLSLPPEEQQNPTSRHQRKKNLKNRLKTRYEKLMSYSDEDIAMRNSNLRVDFYDNPVFRNSNLEIRRKIMSRTLTENDYRTLEKSIRTSLSTLEQSDKMSLGNFNADSHDLIPYSMYLLSQDKPLQRQVTNWDTFQGYVIRLLSGETLSIPEMKSNSIPPEIVLRKARSILRNYQLGKAEGERESLPVETRIFTRKGVDPQLYEEGLIVRRRM